MGKSKRYVNQIIVSKNSGTPCYNMRVRILVVEDEHKIANAVKKGLENERFVVDVAFSGEDGFDLASSEDYDAIILDWMLPDKDGLEIIQELRNSKNHTPILLLTAKGQVENKVMGLDSGADDYMVKPFAFSELTSRVRALTRRPKQKTEEILHLDDLTLNIYTFEVKRKNRKIKLSAKEFSLLEYLLRHKNRILTKDQIREHVWSYDSDILPNTVEVYIKKLREKVDKNEKKPLIHTARGFGYKIGI